jgi:hypothetical protein
VSSIHRRETQSHLLASWLSGALIGLFAGALLVSWLPFLLKPVAIVVIALALNAPRTRTSRSLQVGFLFSTGIFAFIVLMLTNTLAGPLAVLLLIVQALGFVRTLQVTHWPNSA